MQTAAELSSETPKRIAMSAIDAKPKQKALSALEKRSRVGPKKLHFVIPIARLSNGSLAKYGSMKFELVSSI